MNKSHLVRLKMNPLASTIATYTMNGDDTHNVFAETPDVIAFLI
jgi:hypothetical protein